MRYGITRLARPSPGVVEITRQEYESISSAKKSLIKALFLEQNFDLVVENYFEYELELLSLSTRSMLSSTRGYLQGSKDMLLVIRRIANLLSTCRLYLDQSSDGISNIYGSTSANFETVKQETHNQYDTHIGYQAMEELRDHVQHKGYPIHSITHSMSGLKDESGDKVLFTFTPSIRIADLEEDKKFKADVLAKLKAQGNTVDIKPLMREYIESLFRIHKKIRELIHDDIVVWEGTINDATERFQQAYGQDTSIVGLAIVAESEEGIYPESEELFTGFLERRRELESKNSVLEGLTEFYVSSK